MTTTEPEIIRAPWTDEQVLALLKWQTSPLVPSFTCAAEHEILIPRDGIKEKLLAGAKERGIDGDWIEQVDWSEPLQGHGLLVPTNEGWRCGVEECMYVQDWCHAFMANGALEDMISRFPDLDMAVGQSGDEAPDPDQS